MKSTLFVSILSLCLAPVSSLLFAGNATPGDGGVQIYFSDDGMGGTKVTASGTGRTDDDGTFVVAGLGFTSLSSGTSSDLVDSIPPGTPPFPDLGAVPMDDVITLNLSDAGDIVLNTFFSSSTDFGFNRESPDDPVTGTTQTLSVVNGTATALVDYSVFSALHGRSIASTDGFTLVFQSSPSDAACADKSQLLRKIKKLKKKLKKAKQAGNVSAAQKLKKNLKKLKKKYKSLC